MRIFTLVLATLMLLSTSALAGFLAYRNLDDAKQVDELVSSAKSIGAEPARIKDVEDHASSLRRGAVAFVLTAIFAFGALVLTFANRGVPFLAGLLIVAAVAAIAINPEVELVRLGAASARKIAYVTGVVGTIGALFALGAHRLGLRRTAGA